MQTFAFFQWGEGYITRQMGIGDSVTEVDDTIIGYPEISLFKSSYFMPKIASNESLTARFEHVIFSDVRHGIAYRHLFDVPPRDVVNVEAPEASLFNLDTFKELLRCGAQLPDVTEIETDPSAGDLSNLTTVMGNLTERMHLNTPEQTYMLYLYIRKLVD